MTPIDSLRAEVRALRAELNALRETMVAPQWTLTSKSSAMGAADEVQTADDDSNRGQRPVSRTEPFGLRNRPPAKLRSFSMRIGTSNVVFLGIQPSKGYGPSGLDDGEVSLYCSASGTRVYLDKNGVIHIDAASGQDVIVNGGSLNVARKTDKTVADTTMAAFITAVCAKFNAPAAPMASAPGSLTPPTDFGVINGGADHFKG